MEVSEEARQHVYCQLKNFYSVNHSIGQPWHFIFSLLYFIISIFAFLCNSLLLISLQIHTKRKSTTPEATPNNTRCQRQTIRSIKAKLSEETRDNLIGWLAVFDLLLGLTMPFTASDVLSKYWPFGPNTELLGRLTLTIPTIVIYSSSMIIILIAINCYRQIIHSSEQQLTPRIVRYIVAMIIVISTVISTPIFYYTKLDYLVDGDFEQYFSQTRSTRDTSPISNISADVLKNHTPTLDTTPSTSHTAFSKLFFENESEASGVECDTHNDVNLSYITFIYDDWPIDEDLAQKGKLYHSIFSLFAQLIIPSIVISFLYYSVYKRLQRRSTIQNRVSRTKASAKQENDRNKRRNKLLLTISLVYFITWLPFGIVSLLMVANLNVFGDSTEGVIMLFMTCHLLGMSSACANPIIYGYRNKHVRKGMSKLYFRSHFT